MLLNFVSLIAIFYTCFIYSVTELESGHQKVAPTRILFAVQEPTSGMVIPMATGMSKRKMKLNKRLMAKKRKLDAAKKELFAHLIELYKPLVDRNLENNDQEENDSIISSIGYGKIIGILSGFVLSSCCVLLNDECLNNPKNMYQ